MTTNPAFVDAFLLGLNAQVVAELRFRNYPLIPGWTPVRTFWDRANAATGDVDDDIVDIGDLAARLAVRRAERTRRRRRRAPTSSCCSTRRCSASTPARSSTWCRRCATPTAALDWANRPELRRRRQFPAFQGRISSEQTFFGFDLDPALGAERWVVLEETVNGRRFFNAADQRPSSGDTTAPTSPRDTVSAPRRVLIRGDILLGGV